jgi:hypothetical protein
LRAVAQYFQQLDRLGAFLVFEHDAAGPSQVIQTLARQLSTFDTRIAAKISAAIDSYDQIPESSNSARFSHLLLEPLSSLNALQAEGPIVIVLDAFSSYTDSDDWSDVLALLAEKSAHLPPWVRMIVASRSPSDPFVTLGSPDHILATRIPPTARLTCEYQSTIDPASHFHTKAPFTVRKAVFVVMAINRMAAIARVYKDEFKKANTGTKKTCKYVPDISFKFHLRHTYSPHVPPC